MIKHIVFWNIKDNYEGKNKQQIAQQIKDMLDHCGKVIPGIIDLEVGIGGGNLEATFDVVLYSVFENKEALDAYQTHPEHEKVKSFIGAVKTARECMDYEVS